MQQEHPTAPKLQIIGGIAFIFIGAMLQMGPFFFLYSMKNCFYLACLGVVAVITLTPIFYGFSLLALYAGLRTLWRQRLIWIIAIGTAISILMLYIDYRFFGTQPLLLLFLSVIVPTPFYLCLGMLLNRIKPRQQTIPPRLLTRKERTEAIIAIISAVVLLFYLLNLFRY